MSHKKANTCRELDLPYGALAFAHLLTVKKLEQAELVLAENKHALD